MTVQLQCIACRQVDGERMVSWPLDAAGVCSGCGIAWPMAGGLPVLLRDRAAGVYAMALADRVLDALAALPTHGPDDSEARGVLDVLATWAPAHWGKAMHPPAPHAEMRWLVGWLDHLPPGPVLVLGSGAGGELAMLAPADREVWALDATPVLVRCAQRLAQGDGVLPLHRDALRYATRPVTLSATERNLLRRIHLLCADALDPPFEAETFAAVIALNLLDAVAEPLVLLGQCEALLQPGGVLLLASPYHWQASVTPGARQMLRWLPDELELPEGMERLLTGRAIPGFLDTLQVERRAVGVPWTVPVHPGFQAQYRAHVVRLRKN